MAKKYSAVPKLSLFSGSTLKILACVFMLIDHMGLILFPDHIIFRVIGRLAFPLFAYFIAEGCHYSKHKLKRFLMIFGIGIAYFVFYYVFVGDVYASVFLTFSFSIALIELMAVLKKWIFKGFAPYKLFVSIIAFGASLVPIYILFSFIHFDYGFYGMLVPVAISLFDFGELDVPKSIGVLDSFYVRLVCCALALLPIAIFNNQFYITLFGAKLPVQYVSLLSVLLLLFYNGKVGNPKMKYVFYFFYPVHLVVLEGIAVLLQLLA